MTTLTRISKAGIDPLFLLGEAIEAAHQAAQGAARTALDHALDCGDLLLQAKAAVSHGDWLPWLHACTTVTARQSQNYMRLARHRAAIAKCEPASHLTMRGAIRAIATPKKERADFETFVDQSAVDGTKTPAPVDQTVPSFTTIVRQPVRTAKPKPPSHPYAAALPLLREAVRNLKWLADETSGRFRRPLRRGHRHIAKILTAMESAAPAIVRADGAARENLPDATAAG